MGLVFRQTLKSQRLALAILTGAVFGFEILIPATFSTFGEGLDQFFRVLPEGLQSLLSAQGLIGASPTGYIAATAYRHPMFLIVVIGYAVATAAGAMSREVERGTIYMLLSRPVARWRIVLARIAVLVVGLVVLLAAAMLGTVVGALGFGLDDVDFGLLLLVQVNGLALLLAVSGYSFLVSAVSNEGNRVIAVGGGLAVLFFFVDFLAGIWDTVEALGPISLFHYYDPVAIVEAAALSPAALAVLLTVAVAGFAAAIVAFERRDITR